MLSETALQEFKKIWREEFNEEISDEEGVSAGTSLLTLFDHIYRPVKKQWLETVPDNKKNNENNNEHNSIPNQK